MTPSSFTYKRIVFHPKPPGFHHPILSVSEPKPGAARNAPPRNRNSFFNPDSISTQISFIKTAIDSQRNAQTGWSAGQLIFRAALAPATHHVQTLDRLAGARTQSMCRVLTVRDHIELVVHALNEITISRAADA